jgi:hypothetical protein
MAPARRVQQELYNDRLSERVAVEHSALLEREGGEAVGLRLTDLSGGGFQGECEEPVEIGRTFMLNLGPAGSYPVRILWQLGPNLGGEFTAPLSWGRLFALLVAIHTGETNEPGWESSTPLLR